MYLSDNLLVALLDGALPLAERAALMRHIEEECLSCQALYEAAGGAVATDATQAAPASPAAARRRRPPSAFDEFRLIRPLGAGGRPGAGGAGGGGAQRLG